MLAPLKSAMSLLHRPVYEARKRALVRLILPHLKPGDRVLDVGCGWGALGRALLDDPAAPKGLAVEGLERVPRGNEAITVHAYDGGRMPFADDAYDAVIVADVLHHEPDEPALLKECARVARRALFIKDHQVTGPLAQKRIELIDWAANAPYGVPCLFRYRTPAQWADVPGMLHMRAAAEHRSINLYPPLVNALFGRRLQYMAVLEHEPRQEPPA